MAFSLSPGVEVIETDLSTSIPSSATSIGAYSGNFGWGPVHESVTITDEIEFVRRFGKPTFDNYIDFFSAANFLSYSSDVKIVRTGNLNVLKNASSNSRTQILIKNDMDYFENWSNNNVAAANAAGPFVARFPGVLGNSIKYSVCDANTEKFFSWEYSSIFSDLPSTSEHASLRGGSNDEVHIVVVDQNGVFTDQPGTILEKYSNLSRSRLAKDDTGSSIYYKTVIENSSRYIRCVSEPKRPRRLANIAWNTGAYSNSGNVFLTIFDGGAPYKPTANARIFCDPTTNNILNLIVYDGGLYSDAPTVASLIGDNGEISATFTARLAPEYIPKSSNFANNGGINWDVKDLEFQNRTVVVGDTAPDAVAWKPNGTVMYFIGNRDNTITQAAVAEPWNYPSYTKHEEFRANNVTNTNYLSTSIIAMGGLYFKPDGTKFYHGDFATDAEGRRVYEYEMTEAWNVLTASCGTNHYFSTLSQDSASPRDVHFKDDGTRMYVLGATNDRIYQYSLSTPWSANTASFTFSRSLISSPTTPSNMVPIGMHFIKDGTVLVITDSQSVTTTPEGIYQYRLTEAWNVATIVLPPVSSRVFTEFDGVSRIPATSGMFISPDEENLYISDAASDAIFHYRLSIGDNEYTSNSSKNYYTVGGYSVQLRDGKDSIASDSNVITGYSYFNNSEELDIGLVITGNHSTTVKNSIISSLGEGRKDCLVFVSPNYDDVINSFGTEATKIINTRNTITSSSYAVMDSGWKYQYDKYNDTYRWIPLNGDIAGLCAKTDKEKDPWYSPGGFNRGIIKNIVKLAYNPNKSDRDLLYLKQINPVVTFSDQGTVLLGDKTLFSKPNIFESIATRRLFIIMNKNLTSAAKYSLFENNDASTRSKFIGIVEPYLRDIKGRRGIVEYRVVCDETNNTQEIIDRNEFVGDIYIKPNKSINFIRLNFVSTRTGVSFEEIVGKKF